MMLDEGKSQIPQSNPEPGSKETEAVATALATILGSKTSTTGNSAAHIVKHPQGGIGKSVIASWLAQTITSMHRHVNVIDADPMNKSLSRFKCLLAEQAQLINDDELDLTAMDELIQVIADEPSEFVLDMGASGFTHIASYMMRNDILGYLAECGKQVYVHTVVVGGDRQDDTLARAREQVQQMPAPIRIVAWINPHFGPLRYEQQIIGYLKDNGARVVRIPNTHPRENGVIIANMLKDGITFAELFDSEATPLAKRRVRPFWDALRSRIEDAISEA